MSNNQIRIYDSTGATLVNDPDGLLDLAEQIRFSTIYPGGIYNNFTCFISCDPLRYIPIKHMNMLRARNGLEIVWEGYVVNIAYVFGDGQGIEVEAVGAWQYADARYKYARWIDRRYQSNIYGVWMPFITSSAPDKCTYDQNNRLYFVPKAVAWTSGEYAALYYITNAAENVKRIKFSYDFAEAAQAWELRLYDVTNSTALWTVSATGTGTQDITLSPTAGTLRFEFTAKANQTPAADGTIYGKITDLACVSKSNGDTANVTVDAIMKDMVYFLGSPFANDYTYIAANTYDLLSTGFVQDDLTKSIAKQMIELGTFSATNTAYSVGCLASDAIPANNGPVIYYEAYPALTDYDYAIRLDEAQLQGMVLVASAAFGDDGLYNNAFVVHTDSTGKTQWAYSADDALLADATSTTKYGTRVHVVRGGQSATLAGAGVFGRPYVATHKDLQFYMREPLTITGTIRKKDGTSIPVSQVRAGKRLKIENFVSDVGDVAGSGLTFLITNTEYNDAANTVTITAGMPDDLAIYLARQAVMNDRYL